MMFKFELADKEKRVIGNMKRDGELETLLNEISNGPYFNLHHQQKPLVGVGGSPVSRVSLQSEYSSSSSFSNEFCSSEDGSPFATPFEETKYQTPSTHYLNGLSLDSKSNDSHFRKNINEKLVDEQDLCENLCRMRIGDEQKDCSRIRRFEMDPDGLGFGCFSSGGTIPWNVKDYGPNEGLNNVFSDYGGFQYSPRRVSASFNNNKKLTPLGSQGGYKVGDSMGFNLAYSQSNALHSTPSWYNSLSNYPLEQRKGQGRSCDHRGIQLQNPSNTRPYLSDAFVCSQQCGKDSDGGRCVIDSLNSTQLMPPKLALNVEHPLHNGSLLKGHTRAMPNRVSQSLMPMKGAGEVEGFSCEDSFIIQGKNLNNDIDKGCYPSRVHKKNTPNEITIRNPQEESSKLYNSTHNGAVCENGQSPSSCCPPKLEPSFSSLTEVQGCIYLMTQDQNGCRFLQRMFEEGTCLHVQIIFNEIIDHVVELMMEPFGNYLVQKLLDVCNEEQRTQIVLMVTKKPGQLIRVSLNTYGTRVVQKLIETLKTRQQISSVKSALKPGFLDLIKDLNGNHVIQRCLQCLCNEDNEFIFDAAAMFCVEIATHRHGCCVMQRCIAYSIGEHRDKLITQISSNGLLLAQDPFGNYVVQYIIELKIPSATAKLISQFKGHYLHLSTQKFSSHVVEKCLKHLGESRSRIIRELLSVSHFERLLQDPFANYVIQSALAVTKQGPLHALLVEAVRPHIILRTSPYCKRIFSRNLWKK